MKKNILLWCVFSCAVILTWCGTKQVTTDVTPISGEDATANIQIEYTSWMELPLPEEWSPSERKGTGQSETKSSTQQIASGQKLSDDVKKLIEERAKKPVDKSKLTEDDIDLMEKVIQKVQQQ